MYLLNHRSVKMVINISVECHKKLKVFCSQNGFRIQGIAQFAIWEYIDQYESAKKEEGESLI